MPVSSYVNLSSLAAPDFDEVDANQKQELKSHFSTLSTILFPRPFMIGIELNEEIKLLVVNADADI